MNDYFKDFTSSGVDKHHPIRYHVEDMNCSENHPDPVFIGFSGRKQSGKNTAADLTCELLLENGIKNIKVVSFADTLKQIAIDVLGISADLVYGNEEKRNELTRFSWSNLPYEIRLKYYARMTVREVLQLLGTDIFRDMFDDNIWVDSLFRRDFSNYKVVLITDCRFPNEKQAIEDRGGFVVRLNRLTSGQDTHKSETILQDDDFDVVYNNNGTLNELKHFLQQTLKDRKVI